MNANLIELIEVHAAYLMLLCTVAQPHMAACIGVSVLTKGPQRGVLDQLQDCQSGTLVNLGDWTNDGMAGFDVCDRRNAVASE